jgi:uncharacterized protein YbjT (DUF2867 family)
LSRVDYHWELTGGDDPAIDPAEIAWDESLTDARIAEILSTLEGAPLGLGEDDEFRISLAGVQEKTALLYLNDAWHIPHGRTEDVKQWM